MKDRTVILVYVDPDGVAETIAHLFDGTLKEHKPTVTVGSSLNGFRIPMMTKDGRLEESKPGDAA